MLGHDRLVAVGDPSQADACTLALLGNGVRWLTDEQDAPHTLCHMPGTAAVFTSLACHVVGHCGPQSMHSRHVLQAENRRLDELDQYQLVVCDVM